MSASQFGQLLRHLRTSSGATLAEVAEGTGISVPMLSRMERGERLPSAETIDSLATYFGVSADVLTRAVVAQHASNRYPRSWDSWRRESEVDALGLAEAQALAPSSSAAAEPPDVARIESAEAAAEPNRAMVGRSPERPVDLRGNDAFQVRPIAALFRDVSETPTAALEDAVQATRAAVRQLAREYKRSSPALSDGDRRHLAAQIAQLRAALDQLAADR